jgi:DNA-binding LytR/AlgR family response regulator
MKPIRAIIADDEEALRGYLRKKLAAAWPELDMVGEAVDGASALRLIEEQEPDVAFLDIQMPGLSGIEVARKVAGTCAVVFITAFNQYAVEAFENEALDYLVKPVTDERLRKTVGRLKERLSSAQPLDPNIAEIIEKVALSFQKSSGYLQWIKTQHKDGVRLIPVGDIYYFRAADKYTTVRTRDGEYLIRKTIKELEQELDPDQFWRVHRAAIVNAKAIQSVSHSLAGMYKILFKDIQDDLAVSRAYSHLFKQM